MATYQVTTKSGTFEINSPKELSNQELQSYIAKSSGAAPAEEAAKPAEPNFAERIFPGATKEYENRMYKPAGSLVQSAKDIGAVGLAGLGDLTSYEARFHGAWTGKTAMNDPEGGVLKGRRQADNEDFDQHIQKVAGDPNLNPLVKRAAVRGLQLGKLLRSGLTGMEEAPITTLGTLPMEAARGVGSLIKGMAPAAKDAILKLADLPQAANAVETMARGGAGAKAMVAGSRETPDNLAAALLQNTEKINRGNQQFSDAAKGMKETDLSNALKSASPRPNGPLAPYDAGKTLEYSLKNAKTTLGDIFKSEQDRVLDASGVSKEALNKTPVPAGAKIKRAPTENPAQQEVQGFLSEIQYDPQKGYGVSGNRVVDQKAVSALHEVYDQLGTANSTRDILDQRRLIDNKIRDWTGGESPTFAKGSDSEWALKQVRNRLNDVIEKQFYRGGANIPDRATADAFAKAWRANNENFSSVADALSGAHAEIKNANAEEYIKSISGIGVDNLKKIFETAGAHKELQPVAQELRSGFVDHFLAKSTKNGALDFGLASKNWATMDPALKKTMLEPGQISKVENALSRYSKTEVGEPETAGKFFSGGKSDLRTASKTLANIANPDKRHALAELQFLDDLNGLKGEDRISVRALAMAQAGQLGMENGRLPITSSIRTGKFQAAAGAGFATGAAIGSHVPVLGTAVGGLAGMAGGVYSQSPAGAVFAFRALNKLGGLPNAAQVSLKDLAKRAAYQATARGAGNTANQGN